MSSSHATPKHSAFTQWCRGLIQMLSYEDILSITVYLPPMLFMVGPAAIVANNPWITLVLNAIVGFAFSWVLHRVGHRLLMVLPNEPKAVYLSDLNAPACETYADSIRVDDGGHRRGRGFQRGRGKAILSCRRCSRGSG